MLLRLFELPVYDVLSVWQLAVTTIIISSIHSLKVVRDMFLGGKNAEAFTLGPMGTLLGFPPSIQKHDYA